MEELSKCSPRTLRRLNFVLDLLNISAETGQTEVELLQAKNKEFTRANKPLIFESIQAYRSFKYNHQKQLKFIS